MTIQAIILAATQVALMELKTMQNPTPTGMTALGLENEVPVPRPSLRSNLSIATCFTVSLELLDKTERPTPSTSLQY